jgi:hypothetical protein
VSSTLCRRWWQATLPRLDTLWKRERRMESAHSARAWSRAAQPHGRSQVANGPRVGQASGLDVDQKPLSINHGSQICLAITHNCGLCCFPSKLPNPSTVMTNVAEPQEIDERLPLAKAEDQARPLEPAASRVVDALVDGKVTDATSLLAPRVATSPRSHGVSLLVPRLDRASTAPTENITGPRRRCGSIGSGRWDGIP